MSVRILTAFALALLAVPPVLKEQSGDDRAALRRLNQKAAAAHQRKDFPAFLPPGAETLRVLVDVGPLVSPQGIAWSPDGTSLFVADYTQGIARVDARDGTVRVLDVPQDAVVTGIDGLIWADGSLVGIQNGVRPHRVARHRLDPSFERVEEITVLERGNPSFDEPTLGVRVGADLYYVENSQYRFVGDDGTLDLDRPPAILRVPLPWMHP